MCFNMYVLMLASSKLAALCMYANAFRDLVRENYEIIPCWVRDADFAEEILTLSKKTNDSPNTVDDAEHEVGEPDCTGQQLVVACQIAGQSKLPEAQRRAESLREAQRRTERPTSKGEHFPFELRKKPLQ